MHGDLRVNASMAGLILLAICGAHTHAVGTVRRGGGRGLPSADGSSHRTAYGPEAYILVDEHDGDVRAGGEPLEGVLNLRGCRLCGQTSTGRGEEGCGC